MWGSILIYLGGRLFQLVWGRFEISWAPICVLLVGANLKLFVGRVVLFLLCLGTVTCVRGLEGPQSIVIATNERRQILILNQGYT